MTTGKHIRILAAISGFLSVGFGAFGAHALKGLLEAYHRIDTFELAVRYQFYHTLVLLFIGMLASEGKHVRTAWLFTAGILFFSGSLYFLALTNSTALVLVTPVGGLFLLAGWASLAFDFYKK